VGYIVENIDVLGPHTGPLVKHIDELLLFADESEVHSRYFPELLPFVQVPPFGFRLSCGANIRVRNSKAKLF
jgi:hypothetical protein